MALALQQQAALASKQLTVAGGATEKRVSGFVSFSGLRGSRRQDATHSSKALQSQRGRKQSLRIQAVVESPKDIEKKTTLQTLWAEHQQSPWYDNLKRPVNFLQKEIELGIRGVTSNPTIFQKAIMGSDLYDEQFRALVKAGKSVEEAYWEMVVTDIEEAADLFKPLWEESGHLDGYISVEVSPDLAHDGPGTVAAAKDLHSKVARQNVYIKIPATKECIPAIEEVIASGISVNVTLIFSDARYEEVMEAYISGLEKAEGDLSKISSVASFFISRVDTLVDKKLEALGTEEAKSYLGKAAIAQSKMAYELYQKTFSGPRWEALQKRGAQPQRLLWASTGTKNPKYPDTLYVDSLIGPGTVNTMPDAAVDAFIDHGTVARTIDADVEEARKVYNGVEELGIKWDDTGAQLEDEGVASFKASFDQLLGDLKKKASALLN